MSTATSEHVTLLAPAISCGNCVAKVQNAVSEIEGVSRVQASAETKFVDVDFDPEQTSVEAISDALAGAGYPAHR
ncbi:MAG TPA: heavy-metal-associated domain-containing protein [Thermomicrobiales bacterium]|nr:heavy-metal-associated domain-containing protein [Thermomicrobiales bacterium]